MTRRPFLGALLLCAVVPAFWARATSGPDSTPTPAAAPIVVGGRVLFTVRERLGHATARARADAIERSIGSLAREAGSAHPRLAVVDSDSSTEIVSGERVIVTLMEGDVAGSGLTRHEAATRAAASIEDVVFGTGPRTSARALALDGALILFGTAILVGVLWILQRGSRALITRLETWQAAARPRTSGGDISWLGARRLGGPLVTLIRTIRYVLVLFAALVYLSFVLSVLPWTQEAVSSVREAVLAPLREAGRGLVNYLPSLISLVVIIALTHFAIKAVRAVFVEIERGTITVARFDRDWAMPTFKIVRLLILAFAVVVSFPYVPGSDSAAFKGVSIFLGVLFSLSSSTAVANAVAGTILTYTRAFRPGDRVKIGETLGDVVEKTLFVTRVNTLKNEQVAIPNSTVLGTPIMNYSTAARESGLILHTSVTIGYDAPWRRVHELLLQAAGATRGVLSEPAPFVLQIALNDFFVTYEINAYTDEPLRTHLTYAELHQNIQDAFHAGGVEIMSPHYTSVRDGNTAAIPKQSRPASYRPGALRVRNLPHDNED